MATSSGRTYRLAGQHRHYTQQPSNQLLTQNACCNLTAGILRKQLSFKALDVTSSPNVFPFSEKYSYIYFVESPGNLNQLVDMDKKFKKALVIGKFQPLHKGHLALIDYAKDNAEQVDMLVTANENEEIPLAQRFDWAQETFSEDSCVNVYGYLYDPKMLTASSESDLQSSKDWADYLMKVHVGMHEVDVIIGSERYVQYMADYLGISYMIYDEKRDNLKISATLLKSDIIRYWDYLAPAVKRTYVRHICICGSESTGKSTTCKRLEENHDFVTMIPEIGRCLVGKSELCSLLALQNIYAIHHQLLSAVTFDPPTPVIIWDTDSITTISYFKYLYPDLTLNVLKDKCVSSSKSEVNKADKYYFFVSNIEFKDDGTRFSEDEAKILAGSHLQTYLDYGISPEIITASDRYNIVESAILAFIDELKNTFACK